MKNLSLDIRWILLDLSWNEVFDIISIWIISLLFFGNNSVHRIIILVVVWMTGSMQETAWIRPYVLLVARGANTASILTPWCIPGPTNQCRLERISFISFK